MSHPVPMPRYKLIVVRPWCGQNHLAIFFKDGSDPTNSPVYGLYYGWSREVDGWYLEMTTSGSTHINQLHFGNKDEMEKFLSEAIGVTVVVEHDGPK